MCLQIGANNVKIASQVLYNVIENMRSKYNRTKNTLIEARQLLSQELVESATTVTSNLIEAASLAVQRYENTVSLLHCRINNYCYQYIVKHWVISSI